MWGAAAMRAHLGAITDGWTWVTSHPIESGALLSVGLYLAIMGYYWRRFGRRERWMAVLSSLGLLMIGGGIVREALVPAFALPLWASLTYTLFQLVIFLVLGVLLVRHLGNRSVEDA